MSTPTMMVLVTAIASLIAAPQARTCTIEWRSQNEVEKEAQVVVVAEILSARHVASSFRGDNYDYEIRVERSERGGVHSGPASATYDDLKAHRRGDAWVCPLKTGSGIENHLEPGSRYVLYASKADKLVILLARVAKD